MASLFALENIMWTDMEWVPLLWAAALVSAALVMMVALKVLQIVWWTPLQLKKCFEAQGIQGPPYKLLYGNAPDIVRMTKEESRKPLPLLEHNIVPRVVSAYHQWRKTYGEDYVYWFGTKARVYVSHPELVKEILSNKFGHFEKLKFKQLGKPGLAGLEGETWALHRRILNPAFHTEQLKGMIPSFVESATNMLGEWSKLVSSGSIEIDVQKEFNILTSDIISRTAFGSSYVEGKRIFNLLAQQILFTHETFTNVYIPGSRFLPTKKNRQRWWLANEIRSGIQQVIEGRDRSVTSGKEVNSGTDLLGLMMTSNKQQRGGKLRNNKIMSMEEIISECKIFYLAGQETTAILLTWTVILLGMHQDWQERARREVLEVCGRNKCPNADNVNRLKIVGIILNEALRLYPPVVLIHRQTYKPMKLGRLEIPAGTQLQIPILAIHHDPAFWGNDAHEFNPERFNQGISQASKHPMAFMPFGLGPRTCIGQNFALQEAKVVLAMILQRFSFVIAPSYVHAPMLSVMLKPQHGAHIIFHKK